MSESFSFNVGSHHISGAVHMGNPLTRVAFDKNVFGDNKKWTLNFKVQEVGLGALTMLVGYITSSILSLPLILVGGYVIYQASEWKDGDVAEVEQAVVNGIHKAAEFVGKLFK